MRRLKTLGLITLLLVFASVGKAPAVHKGAGGLVCGQCHTMHNSQGRLALNMGGPKDGALLLLRGNVNGREEIHKLCLQCHATNGAWAEIRHAPKNVPAPKVYSDAPWSQDESFGVIGAGGNFSTELNTNWDAVTPETVGFGHSVGAKNIRPPGGDKDIPGFSCTNCHDPHGTDDPSDPKINIYRNLRVKPLDSGAGILGGGVKFWVNKDGQPVNFLANDSYVGGVNGQYFGGNEKDLGGNVIWPMFKGTLTGDPKSDFGNTNIYGSGLDRSGAATISKWCAQCHDKWHSMVVPENRMHIFASAENVKGRQYQLQLDTKRHAVNSMVPMGSKKQCALKCHVSLLDRTNYNSDLIRAGKGLAVTTSDFITNGNVYYLPDCEGVTSTKPNSCNGMHGLAQGVGHRVFCFTCHFAHGGPNYDNLRWDYNADVQRGWQMGKAIESNVGCQLCHNR